MQKKEEAKTPYAAVSVAWRGWSCLVNQRHVNAGVAYFFFTFIGPWGGRFCLEISFLLPLECSHCLLKISCFFFFFLPYSLNDKVGRVFLIVALLTNMIAGFTSSFVRLCCKFSSSKSFISSIGCNSQSFHLHFLLLLLKAVIDDAELIGQNSPLLL